MSCYAGSLSVFMIYSDCDHGYLLCIYFSAKKSL